LYFGQLAWPRLDVLAVRLGLPVDRFEVDDLGPTIASAGVAPAAASYHAP